MHYIREIANKVSQSSPVLPQSYLQLLRPQQIVQLLQAADTLEISLHGELIVAKHWEARLHGSSPEIVSQRFNGGLQISVGAKPNARAGKLGTEN